MITELLSLKLTTLFLVRRKNLRSIRQGPHEHTLCHSKRGDTAVPERGQRPRYLRTQDFCCSPHVNTAFCTLLSPNH